MMGFKVLRRLFGGHCDNDECDYVGTTEGFEHIHIPGFKMHDAGSGFRPTNPGEGGTTTQFPCLLSLASTWDEGLTGEMAQAIAKEFKGKGANLMLGPSINVLRSARNGRNFEFLSGEDPYLGARLVAPFVRSVQAEGTMACAKHFAFNQQETHGNVVDSHVGDETAWELYYPPWQAAVNAGLASVMCASNKVNGTYACDSGSIVPHDLREVMGFKGLVISDW